MGALLLQLVLGLVAYGRLAEKVDELHDNVHVIQQLLMQRGVNR